MNTQRTGVKNKVEWGSVTIDCIAVLFIVVLRTWLKTVPSSYQDCIQGKVMGRVLNSEAQPILDDGKIRPARSGQHFHTSGKSRVGGPR